MATVFDNIPGYAGYMAKRQMNEQQSLSDLMTLGKIQEMQAQAQALAEAPEKREMARQLTESQIKKYKSDAAENEAKAKKMNDMFILAKEISALPQDHPERAAKVLQLRMLDDPIKALAPAKAEKPLIEHNFPVAGDKVQPHISQDMGKTWTPIPGSVASPKFARQVAPVVNISSKPAPLNFKLKPGERFNEETQKVEIVPGSSLGQKTAEEGIKTSKGLDAVEAQIKRVGLAAKDIFDKPNMSAAVGWWDALTPNWLSLTPQGKTDVASSVKNLQELLQTKGLQELRASGVAPGSITEREWSKFSAMIANIDPSLGEEAFKQELKRVIQNTELGLQSVKETRKQEQERLGQFWPKSGDNTQPPAGGSNVNQIPTGAAPKQSGVLVPVVSEAQALTLPAGTRFRLPDGRTGTAR